MQVVSSFPNLNILRNNPLKRLSFAKAMPEALPDILHISTSHIERKAPQHTLHFGLTEKEKKLLLAAENGMTQDVEYLLNKGFLQRSVNINAQDNSGFTPLHYAAEKGHSKVVSILMDAGADPTIINENNKDAFRQAKEKDPAVEAAFKKELNRAFSEAFKNADKKANKEWEGQFIWMKKLLLGDADFPSQEIMASSTIMKWATKKGKFDTILRTAAHYGELEQIQALIAAGVKPNAKGREGKTPSHYAAANGQIDALQKLHQLKATMNETDALGFTPLQFAVRHGEREAIQVLVKELGVIPYTKDRHERSLFYSAIKNGQIGAIEELHALGLNIHEPDEFGNTPLHWAIVGGRETVIPTLLDLGANPAMMNEQQQTPLMYAKNSRTHKMFKTALNEALLRLKDVTENNLVRAGDLVMGGADLPPPDEQTEFLQTAIRQGRFNKAFLAAAKKGELERLQLFIKAGIDPRAKDDEGMTALHHAAEYGHIKVIRELKAANVDVNATDIAGSTPLHLALSKENLTALEVLVTELNADINAIFKGCTPLCIAAQFGLHKVFKKLLDLGADPSIRDELTNKTLLMNAFQFRNTKIKDSTVDALALALNKPPERSNEAYRKIIHSLNTLYDNFQDKIDNETFSKLVNSITDEIDTAWSGAGKSKSNKTYDDLKKELNNNLKNVQSAYRSYEKIKNSLNEALLKEVKQKDSDDFFDRAQKLMLGGADFSSIADNQISIALKIAIAQVSFKEVLRNLVEQGETEQIQKMLTAGFSPEAVIGEEERTALHYAAENGQIGIIRLFKKYGEHIKEAKASNDFTPLHVATWNARIEAIRVLVHELEVNINAEDNAAHTPLHLSVERNEASIFTELLELGADPSKLNQEGETPWMFVESRGSGDKFKKILDNALLSAVAENKNERIKNERVRKLILGGADHLLLSDEMQTSPPIQTAIQERQRLIRPPEGSVDNKNRSFVSSWLSRFRLRDSQNKPLP